MPPLNSGVRPKSKLLDSSVTSFLTFLLGLALGHWLAIGRDKRKEFNAAAQKFHAAFFQTIQLLRSQTQDVFNIITPAVINDQEKAVIEFERVLSKFKRSALAAAWSRYSSGPYTTAPGSLAKRSDDIAEAQAKFEALLKYAALR